MKKTEGVEIKDPMLLGIIESMSSMGPLAEELLNRVQRLDEAIALYMRAMTDPNRVEGYPIPLEEEHVRLRAARVSSVCETLRKIGFAPIYNFLSRQFAFCRTGSKPREDWLRGQRALNAALTHHIKELCES